LSSGEGWALSDRQFEDMIKFTVKYSKLPVFAGVEFKTTEEVIEKAKITKSLGVQAIVITTPFKKNITQEEIYEHFKKIKDEVNISIFIYNEHAISGNSINFETVVKICQLGNIAGIKEASGSAEFTRKLVQAKLNVPIFQGWEHLCFESKGVEGYILPLLNLEPKLCFEMLQHPTLKKQGEIDTFCKKYNILGKDWYAWLKNELHRRGVISTERVI
ncbi:dihydrodipicolinate synthase family protein, partial [Candidatus Woesearchaeota archaeon]|nr:dihydrodipicolinate synthase family protein [Candidatus Woesearchaeota archaeon]